MDLPNSLPFVGVTQKPEKIKKLTSELVDVPTKNDEITKKEIEPNEPMKKNIKEPDVIKDEDEKEDIN